MSVYVVRHAKAGSRSQWRGEDHRRPLSGAGRRQAKALAKRLAPEAPTSLWASPFVRCVQTLEPLAKRRQLTVRADDRLGEGAPLAQVLALLAEAGDGAVLCSHGDVIPELIQALARRGTELRTPPDWRKATLWVLDGEGPDGCFATATVEPPPGI